MLDSGYHCWWPLARPPGPLCDGTTETTERERERAFYYRPLLTTGRAQTALTDKARDRPPKLVGSLTAATGLAESILVSFKVSLGEVASY